MRAARRIPVNHESEKPDIPLEAIKAPAKLFLEPEAFGRLRRELMWTLGEERTHGLLARVGLSCSLSAVFEDPSRPLVHGIGLLHEKTLSTSSDERVFECSDSVEADEHMRFFGGSTSTTQCWFLAGF